MSEQFPTEPLTGDPNRGDTPGAADAPTTSWWQTVVPFAVIACVLLALLFATLVVVSGPVFFAQPTPAPDETDPAPRISDGPKSYPSQNAMGQHVTADPNSAAESARVAELRAAETQAIRSAKLEQFTTARDQTKEDLANLATEMASWNNLTTELLDGDGGKHIASDVVYIQRFLPIYENEYVTQPQFESFQRRFLSLSEPVDKAKKDSAYLPTENLLSELQALRNEVSAALAKLENARKDAQAIKSFAASRPLSDKPLRAAIEDFRQQQQQARLDQVAEAKRLAEVETTNMLAEKEAEQEKLRREVELARLASENDELRASKRQLDADAKEAEAKRRRDEAQAALVRQFEAEYPAMKSMLTPFTSTGTRQPTTSFQYIDTGERKPVSFGALQRLGYLENSPQNRLYFAKYVTALNNRPAGSFPNLSLDAGGGHEKIRNIQEFLQKYGEIMVDKNLLSP